MTCLNKRPLKLCITRGLEDTDDDKTPEYPLSDDHPLSLKNREKLLNECTDFSPKCVMIMPLSSQIITPPLKPKKTSIDPSSTQKDLLHVDEYLPNNIKQKNDSPIAQNNVSHERINRWRPETSKGLNVWKSVPQALDLAVLSKHKNSIAKQNVSLMARSLLDTSMVGSGALTLHFVDNDHFNNRAPPLPERFSKSHNFEQISSTDSNNNTGHLSRHRPIETKTFQMPTSENKYLNNISDLLVIDKSKAQADNTEIQKVQNPSPSNFLAHTSKMSLPCDFSMDADADDKNVPPHLSPVANICLKSGVTTNSQSPTLPPTLVPIKMDSSFGSPVCEYSTGNNDTDEKLRPHQTPPNRFNSALKETADNIRNNYQRRHESPEKSPSKYLSSHETNGGEKMDTCEGSAKSNERERKHDQIETKSLSPEKHGVDSEGRALVFHNKDKSNDRISEEQPKFTSPESMAPLDKSKPTASCQSNSGNSKGLTKPQRPRIRKKKNSLKPTTLSSTTSENMRASQMFMNSNATSVTSLTSSLCYPYSIQSAHFEGESSKFGQGLERGIVHKFTENVPSDVVDPSNVCPVVPKRTHAYVLHGTINESLAVPTMPLTNAAFLSLQTSPPPYMQHPSIPISSSSASHFASNVDQSNFTPSPTVAPLVLASTADAALVQTTNHVSTEESLQINPRQSIANHSGFSLQKRYFYQPPMYRTSTFETEVVSKTRPGMHQHYKSAPTIPLTPMLVPQSYPKAMSHDDYTTTQNQYHPHESMKVPVQTSQSLQEKLQGSPRFVEVPKTPVSTPTAYNCNGSSNLTVTPSLQFRNHDPLRIASSQGGSPTSSSLKHKDKVNMFHLNRGDSSNNNQHEPLDLSSKLHTAHQTPPPSLGETPDSSATIPNIERLHQPSAGNNQVLAGVKENLAVNRNITPRDTAMTVPSPNSKNDNLRDGSEMDHTQVDFKGRNECPPSTQQQKTNGNSLPNERTRSQDNDDDEWETSSQKSAHELRKRKSLPMENNVLLNPDEKSYSHLAFAAIMSKRKRSLEKCNIPTESENFLDFLGSDLTKKEKGYHVKANTDRLRNGECIDLTMDTEDVLSISSDENCRDIDALSPAVADLGTTNYQLVSYQVGNHDTDQTPLYGRLSEHADNENIECNSGTDPLPGLGCRRKLQISKDKGTCSPENTLLLTQEIGFNGNCCEQPQCDMDERYAMLQQYDPKAQEPLSVLDSKLSHIKEQSLAFSTPQKTWMAKRIQDIISKNAKLLPEYMQPFESSFNLSRRSYKNLPKPLGPNKAYPCKLETNMTSPTKADFHNTYIESHSPLLKDPASIPLTMKRSMSLENDSSSSTWSPKTDFPSRSNSEIYNQQNSIPYGMYLNKEREAIVSYASTEPSEDREARGESSSPYKTVWQTRFVTDSSPSCGDGGRRTILDKPSKNGDDLLHRLELMQHAEKSLNQVPRINIDGENFSTENTGPVKKRRRRSTAKRAANLTETATPTVCPDPVPLLHHDPRVDIVPMPPPVSAQLNPFLPSTFVVAPYYAMAYPLCYPAFPRPPGHNQPILIPPHGPPLNGMQNRGGRPNGRKQNRKTLSDGPPRKRKSINTARNDASEMDNFENNHHDIPPNPPNATLETDINHFNKYFNRAETVRENGENGEQATNPNTIIGNTQDHPGVVRSHLPDHPGDVQGLLDSESNCDTYLVQTRNEDGLTVLSMQYAGENESSDTFTKSHNASESNLTFEHSCRVDLDLLNSVSHGMEFSHAAPFHNTSVPVNSASAPPTSVAQNLATLALASERLEKISSAACSPLTITTDIPFDHVPSKLSSDSDSPVLTVDMPCSPNDSGTTQSIQTPILDTPSSDNEEYNNQNDTSKSLGITEKERQVTEMLAEMMQNRNLKLAE